MADGSWERKTGGIKSWPSAVFEDEDENEDDDGEM